MKVAKSIVSKFRREVYFIPILTIIIWSIITYFFIEYLHRSFGKWVYIISIFIWVMILFRISIMLSQLLHIEITKEGIMTRHILYGRQKFYSWSKLKNNNIDIKNLINYNTNSNVRFNDLILDFSDAGKLRISPKVYENFYEMVRFISRWQNQSDTIESLNDLRKRINNTDFDSL